MDMQLMDSQNQSIKTSLAINYTVFYCYYV